MAVQDRSIAETGYGNIYVNALVRGGTGWDETSGPITYYLGNKADAVARGLHNSDRFADWTATEANNVAAALANFAAVSNLTFQRVFNMNQANLVEWKVPGENIFVEEGADATHRPPNGLRDEIPNQIWGFYEYEGRNPSPWTPQYKGGTGYWMLMHELGHAMGLAHPHDHVQRFPGVTKSADLGTNHENQVPFTIMSYNRVWEGNDPRPDFTYGNAGTLLAFDIAALQAIYGVNSNTRRGNDTYILGAQWWECIWDAGGTDTIDNRNAPGDAVIDLRAATLVEGPNAGGYLSYAKGIAGGFTIAKGVVIENAKGGTGNDVINGNEAANRLEGNSGNDTLWGNTGRDTLVGGAGNDLYHLFDVANGAYDQVVEAAGGGNDTVWVSPLFPSVTSYTMTAEVEIGVIYGVADGFTLTGNDKDNKLFDDFGWNTLIGGAGNDTLNGGAGDDTLIGGLGNDRYELQDRAAGFYDFVVEAANGGHDYVTITAIHESDPHFTDAYTLTANVEDGEIIGSVAFDLTGNGLNNRLFGNSAANRLTGLDGNDSLSGYTGEDTLIGGKGNDFYFLEDLIIGSGFALSRYDTIVEQPGEGTDTAVVFAIDNPDVIGDYYDLPDNVENGTITGSRAFALYGNELGNVLKGNTGANLLSGLDGDDFIYTGPGGDTLDGGAGFDTMVFHKAMVADWQSGVLDPDIGSSTWLAWEAIQGSSGADRIRTNSWGYAVELRGGGGDDVLAAGVSGVMKDTLRGEAGSDTLDGGAGNDRLLGGAGNDSVSGGVGMDRLLGGGGNDTLNGGVGRDRLFGDAGKDRLLGGGGNDTLDGGRGADVLNGGGGRDVFDFNAITDSTVKAAGRDRIAGFNAAATDVMDFSTIDANAAVAGNQAFSFIGKAAFTALGQLRVFDNGTNTFVEVNAQGGLAPDMRVQLNGIVNLDASDFIL